MVIQVLGATRIYRSADDSLSPTSRPVKESRLGRSPSHYGGRWFPPSSGTTGRSPHPHADNLNIDPHS